MPITLNDIFKKYNELLNNFAINIIDDNKKSEKNLSTYKSDLNQFIEDANSKLRELQQSDNVIELNNMIENITQLLNKYELILSKPSQIQDYNKIINNNYDLVIPKNIPNPNPNIDDMREIKTETSWNSNKDNNNANQLNTIEQDGGNINRPSNYIQYNDDNDEIIHNDNHIENSDDTDTIDDNDKIIHNDNNIENSEDIDTLDDNNYNIVYIDATIEPLKLEGGNKKNKREIDVNKWKKQIKNYLL